MKDTHPKGDTIMDGIQEDLESSSVPDATRNNGWTSPVYSRSCHKIIDPKILSENRCIGIFSDLSETGSYKILRTQVHQRMEAMGWKTVMVTSLRSGEGKTLTAINLSLVFAKEYSRTVLLVDSNLKKQDIHAYLGISSEQGLADYLEAGRDLAELIIWPCIEKFTFISGGQPVQNTTELMGSPRMKALVPELKARYHDRYIIFDVPALLEGADALAFLPLVDGVIVVTQAGTTSKNDIVRGLSLIPREKMLGFVLNKWQDFGLKQGKNGPRSIMPAIVKAFAFLKKKIASS